MGFKEGVAMEQRKKPGKKAYYYCITIFGFIGSILCSINSESNTYIYNQQ